MDQDELFKAYYYQYRVESDTPNKEDDEYVIFTGLANEAINRWANYDNTFWKELWNTLQISGDGDSKLGTGNTEYATPDDMRIAGGKIRVYDDTGTTLQRINIIEPQDVQFQSDLASYAYFIGDPNNGFTLNINPEPVDSQDGLNLNYIYYKKPTLLTKPTSISEMTQPYFIVHRSLANRFRGSRNPYYQSAKSDAEDVLQTMKMENNSGNWNDPWELADNSTGRFGD
jgi:hypothetical protein